MIEDSATIAPDRRSIIAGTAARTTRKMPFRSTSKVWSHFSSLSEESGALCAMPALAITASSGPWRFSTSATTALARAVSVTSSAWNSAAPPFALICAATAAPSSRRMSVATTW